MKLNGNAPELFDKIGSLMLLEVSKDQIASIIGCSVKELDEILEREDYQKAYAAKLFEEVEAQKTRNTGWDEIESQALLHLLNSLDSYAMDAEFILKVAALANKAQRRQPLQKPISAVSEQPTVVLQLNQTFLQRLEQYEKGSRPAREFPAKDNQILDADKVEDILSFRPGPDRQALELKEQESVGA